MEATRLSSKGQIVIPKSIRAARGWEPGTVFIVEETDEGLLLKPARQFPATTVDEVLGCAGYKGRKKSLKEMRAAIAKGVRGQR